MPEIANRMPEPPVRQELARARTALRNSQEDAAQRAHIPRCTIRPDCVKEAIEAMRTRWATTDSTHRGYVQREGMRLDRKLEQRRTQRAERIIRRVKPGPFEDPTYLALLAYQAASAEAALLDIAARGADQGALPTEKHLSRVLIGTIAEPYVHASGHGLTKSGYTVIAANRGLVDFVHQAAIAVVSAVNPSRRADNPAVVSRTTDLDIVRQHVAADASSVQRITKCLEDYFYEGHHRHDWNERIPEEHQRVFNHLVGTAERWVIAHEYGHALAAGRDFSDAPNNPLWAEEYVADNWATILTVWSEALFDVLPPEASLEGGLFALASLEVLRRAHALVSTGKISLDRGSESHPPNTERARHSVNTFRMFFDVTYKSRGLFDLQLALRTEVPSVHGFTPERSQAAFSLAKVLLEVLWPRAAQQLGQRFEAGDRPHAMWLRQSRPHAQAAKRAGTRSV